MNLATKISNIFKGGTDRTVTAKRNILWSFGVKGIGIIISLLLVPLTLGYLAEEEYGIWLTLSSMIAWIGFFDIGLTNGLRNKLTEALTLGDNYDLQTSHVLPALIRKFHEAKINNSKEVVLWGTGSPLREFLHADDMADATVFCMLWVGIRQSH